VLSRQQRDTWYFREVVLVTAGQAMPVEFGAIRINLALFPPATRRQILEERLPLGRILRQHSVPHASRPKAFFRLEADSLMTEALQLNGERALFGRRNTLLDSLRRPLAEVVEILPPATASPLAP
jgi:chorismate-pyruvate lyase